VAVLRPTTDGVITIRPPAPADTGALVAGRDDVSHRFLGAGSADPTPAACVVVDGAVAGWVDWDVDRPWLLPGEVNIGYQIFPEHRGHGYATRGVQLLMHHLALRGAHTVGTLLIHPDNARSLALAGRARFEPHGDLDGNPYFKRAVPPLTYTDGVVTIRRRTLDDVDTELAMIDDVQLEWLWSEARRRAWRAARAADRRADVRRRLRAEVAAFGSGPGWMFSVDTAGARGVAQVDCDLGNRHAPPGVANIAYASHPDHRGHGYVTRAVRLALGFARDHTGARDAHLVIDDANVASRRVADAVGARAIEHWIDEDAHPTTRYALAL